MHHNKCPSRIKYGFYALRNIQINFLLSFVCQKLTTWHPAVWSLNAVTHLPSQRANSHLTLQPLFARQSNDKTPSPGVRQLYGPVQAVGPGGHCIPAARTIIVNIYWSTNSLMAGPLSLCIMLLNSILVNIYKLTNMRYTIKDAQDPNQKTIIVRDNASKNTY